MPIERLNGKAALLTKVDIFRNHAYDGRVIELVKTNVFDQWLRSLRDRTARAKIEVRLRRLSLGNPGDVKALGKGVSELRIPYGPGYRVYFLTKGPITVILLCGGDKRTQRNDIALAQSMATTWKEQDIGNC